MKNYQNSSKTELIFRLMGGIWMVERHGAETIARGNPAREVIQSGRAPVEIEIFMHRFVTIAVII
jgi:hypothetical protein